MPRMRSLVPGRDSGYLWRVQCAFSIVDPRTHRLHVERPPHPPVDVTLETRSLLLHDFSHFAVECEMETAAGFYGRLAAGWSLKALRDGTLTDEELDFMMAIERRVALLQSAFKKSRATNDPAFDRLRRIWGAWSKVKSKQQLVLSWPSGEVTVRE